MRTDSAYGNRFMFTGREYLSTIGIYDYRNRMYSPLIGRFLQTDLLGSMRAIIIFTDMSAIIQ